jgi:tetratricopeptide (TPR) repeat protein
LFDRFGDDERLADSLNTVADHYRAVQNYARAEELYGYVLTHLSASSHAVRAARGVVLLEIDQRDLAAVKTAVAALRQDFAGHPHLVFFLHEIGGSCTEAGFTLMASNERQGRDFVQAGIAVLETVALDLPFCCYVTPSVTHYAADCRLRLGDPAGALEHYERIMARWPDYQYAGVVQYLAGDCYQALGQAGAMPLAEAREQVRLAFQKIVEEYPHCAAARAARHELNQD